MAIRTVETSDTYEAAWYLMRGGVLVAVAFGKISENKKARSGHIQKYTFTIDKIESQFVRYWKEHRAMGNVREFANARRSLKRKIYREKKKYQMHY